MLNFSLGLIQGVVSLFSEGPLLYLFGFVLFLIIFKAFLLIVEMPLNMK